mgnify:CR=1 FL=1
MAAQQWAAISDSNPAVNEEIAGGDFTSVNAWRRDRIWQRGSMGTTPEILREATGEALNPAHFIAHLKARYGQ